MENEDQLFYKHCFTVQNNEGDSCTFLCQSQDEKAALLQKILNQIVIAEKNNLSKLEAICSHTSKDSEYLKKLARLDMIP